MKEGEKGQGRDPIALAALGGKKPRKPARGARKVGKNYGPNDKDIPPSREKKTEETCQSRRKETREKPTEGLRSYSKMMKLAGTFRSNPSMYNR